MSDDDANSDSSKPTSNSTNDGKLPFLAIELISLLALLLLFLLFVCFVVFYDSNSSLLACLFVWQVGSTIHGLISEEKMIIVYVIVVSVVSISVVVNVVVIL